MYRFPCLIGLLFCMLAPPLCAASAPQTLPARVEELRKEYAALASPDALVRQRAYQRLVSLKREDLSALQQAVKELRPLDAVTSSTLREIVVEVHAAGDEYEKDVVGFLGINMEAGEEQVRVTNRMEGFVGRRVLRDGDIIVGIQERPLPQDGFQARFIAAVKQFKPGQTIHLQVLRHGQTIMVPATLDARPLDRTGGADRAAYEQVIYEIRYRRAQEAQKYWLREFAPLLEPGIRPQAAAR